jgi:hypothetical protein
MSGVWLITGAQASGKSTTADLLARRFERGVHIRGGQFYRWAVRGWVHFDDDGDPDQQEARRLLDLRYHLSATAADGYAAAGFETVVQDNIYGADVSRWLDTVTARPRHLVVLRPRIEVVGDRHEHRRATTGKVAYTAAFGLADNDAIVDTTPRNLGLWLDTSSLTPDEVVDAILARTDEAVVGEGRVHPEGRY